MLPLFVLSILLCSVANNRVNRSDWGWMQWNWTQFNDKTDHMTPKSVGVSKEELWKLLNQLFFCYFFSRHQAGSEGRMVGPRWLRIHYCIAQSTAEKLPVRFKSCRLKWCLISLCVCVFVCAHSHVHLHVCAHLNMFKMPLWVAACVCLSVFWAA